MRESAEGRVVPAYAFDDQGVALGNWFANKEFLEYLGSSNALPSGLLDPMAVAAKKPNTALASYGYNYENLPGGAYGSPGSTGSVRLQQVASPSKTMLMMTATDWLAKHAGRTLWKTAPVEGKTGDGKIAYRYGKESAGALYYDGHVEPITMTQVVAFDSVPDKRDGPVAITSSGTGGRCRGLAPWPGVWCWRLRVWSSHAFPLRRRHRGRESSRSSPTRRPASPRRMCSGPMVMCIRILQTPESRRYFRHAHRGSGSRSALGSWWLGRRSRG